MYISEWDVKNDFAYVLQFFLLIFGSLGSVQSFYRSVGETLVLFISFTISLLCRQPQVHLTINSDIVRLQIKWTVA